MPAGEVFREAGEETEGLDIECRIGDAGTLLFADAECDAVTLICSTMFANRILDAVLHLGADEVLSKPLSKAELLAKITK